MKRIIKNPFERKQKGAAIALCFVCAADMRKVAVKVVKYSCIFSFFICCLISCKETVRESLHILIQNRTDSILQISLYPKTEYQLGTFYRRYDVGGGGSDTQFALSPGDGDSYNWNEIIFSSSNLNIEPYTLASEVFDSIYICTANKDHVIIKFTHEKVTGYSENIFSEHSTWDFVTVNDKLQEELSKNPQRYYQYRFLILKDKIIINQ